LSTISADGRFIAFESRADNLVEGDTFLCGEAPNLSNCKDIFVHDRLTGETTAVSRRTDGPLGNRESTNPAISADGRFVVFESMADNLIDGDVGDCGYWYGCVNIFLHDRVTGETTIISRGSKGEPVNGDSGEPVVSADGRYVAFDSWADNLTDNDNQPCGLKTANHCKDVFVHDRVTGQTSLISRHTNGTQGNHNSADPSISADGRHVAFNSAATNLTDLDNLYNGQIYVHDRALGTTTLVSRSTEGMPADWPSGHSMISASGRFVTFGTMAGNLVDDDPIRCNGLDGPNSCSDIFLHDRGPVGYFIAYMPALSKP
jgi:Tol biopolymer transport system component